LKSKKISQENQLLKKSFQQEKKFPRKKIIASQKTMPGLVRVNKLR